jgi:hypothetical protein
MRHCAIDGTAIQFATCSNGTFYIEKPRTSQAKIDLTKKNKTKNGTETRIRIEHTVTCDMRLSLTDTDNDT